MATISNSIPIPQNFDCIRVALTLAMLRITWNIVDYFYALYDTRLGAENSRGHSDENIVNVHGHVKL